MGKITIIILAVYLLYYAGNIIYDLFIKKEVIKEDKDSNEFSLEIETEDYQPTKVFQEEVESLSTPASYEYRESFIDEFDADYDEAGLKDLEDKYLKELQLEGFEEKQNKSGDDSEEESEQEPENEIKEEPEVQVPEEKQQEEEKKTFRKSINALLEEAETNVEVALSNDGKKIYKSLQI